MKTLRELILEKHRGMEPKLDEIRRRTIAARAQAAPRRAWRFDLIVWRELILPSRRGWLVLAGAWLVIVALRLGAGFDGAAPAADSLTPSAAAQLAEQHALRLELLASGPLAPAEAPKEQPGPRGMARPITISA
jgi:hypothetical protein